MKKHLWRTPILAVATASLPLAAQARISYGIKFGAGPVVSSAGDQKARATLNFALTAERPFGVDAVLFGELGYRFFRSEIHEVTRFGTGYTPSGGTGTIVNSSSVDDRNDTLQGYVLNAGYRRQIVGMWHWHAGLILSSLTSTQEVTGQIQVGTSREGLNYTPSKTAFGLGAFAGIQAQTSKSFFLELNLSSLGYSQVNYIPLSYTGQPATTETKTKNKLVVDANLGFRF